MRTAAVGRARLAVLLTFWVLPAALFAALTLAGHPPLVGDGLLQNYPLRVLVGQLLRHGVWPLWNPYIWSGTPLLAGSNAGAAYPATLLFAVLPAALAWLVNLVLVYGVAGTGMYRLLSDHGLAPAAAWGGALAFAGGGFLTGQFEHLGLIEGASLLPWLLLACRRLHRPRWALVFGLLVALTVLTGDPRAIASSAIAVLVAAGAVLLAGQLPRPRYLLGAAAGVAAGLAVSAVYWIPAFAAVSSSQRGGHPGFQFFSAGSLQPGWLLLLLVPYLMGSPSELWRQYFGPYNFSEISSYCGVFALFAAGALLPRLWRRQAADSALAVLYLLGFAGLLLALGGNTPLGHPLAALPIYGGMRLQSRNLELVDFALAGLTAHWLHRAFTAPLSCAPSSRWRVLGYAAPALLAAAVGIAVLAAPGVAQTVLQAPFSAFRTQWPYYLTTVAVAGLGGWLASRSRRWPPHRRIRWMLGFLAGDLALAVTGLSFAGPAAAQLGSASRPAQEVGRLIGAGRFAVYDPWQSAPGQLVSVGAPDLNVLRAQPSVQGYGSIVRGAYDATTGAHQQDSLAVQAVASGALDQLDLQLLLAPAEAFVVTAGGGERGPPEAVSAPLRVPAGGSAGRFLGPPLSVSTVIVSAPGSPAGSPLRIGLATPGGHWYYYQVRVRDGTAVATLPGPVRAVALRLRNPGPSPLTATALEVGSGRSLLSLDGPLVGAMRAGHWRYLTSIEGLAAYRNVFADPPLRLVSGSARLIAAQPQPAPWVVPSAVVAATTAVTLIRDSAFSPGWVAVASAAHRRLELRVAPAGLVQSVRLPPGDWTVRFYYRPRLVAIGGWLTAGALCGLALAALLSVARKRRATRR